MKVVFREFKPFAKELILLVIASLIMSFCLMAIPMCMQQIIDEAIPAKNNGLVFRIAGKMILFLAIELGAGILAARTSSWVAMGIGMNLRTKVFHKVQGFSQSEIDTFSASSLITRTNNDIKQVQTFLANCFQIAVVSPLMCIAGLIMALITSRRLSLVLVIAIPLMAITVVLIGTRAIPLSIKLQDQLDVINRVIREKLTGVRVIRAFGTGEYEREKFDKINKEYTKTDAGLQYMTAALRPVVVAILALTIGGMMYMAYYQVSFNGASYTTGMVMSMISYIMQIMMTIILLTIVFLLMPRATAAAKRVEEVLLSVNEIREPESPKDNPDQQGYLTFENVSFAYKGADVPALKNLSFEAKPGEITAIIGGTGAGKTTIVNLIPRLYDVTEGRVLVDGVDVRDYDIATLRSKIGFVPQKALLFKGTINSNIAFGDKNPAEEQIEHAIRVAQSEDFVLKKEGQYDAHVAQGGTNFSGGQKQRLCIARAIVRKPEIYVFDDSFSALDFKTDKTLRAELKKETGNATTVIVAQRIGTIMDADRIIVIDNGDIVGIGKHKGLLKNCSVYREIAESQLSKEELEK